MRYLLVFLLLCVCLIGSNGLLLSPMLKTISNDLDVTIGTVSKSIAAYGAGTAISAIFLGRSLDGFGLNRALFWSMAMAGFCQIVSAFSQNWIMLGVLQMLVGASAGIALPSIYGLTAAISLPGQQAKTLSRVTLGWSLSLIAAIPVAAYTVDIIGWRATLFSFGLLHLSILIPLRVFRSQPVKAETKFSILTPFKLKGSLSAYSINFIFMGCFYGVYAFSGAHAVTVFAQTTSSAGLIALIYGIGFGLASFGAKYLDQVSPNISLPIGLIMATVTLIAIGYAPSYTFFLVSFGVWGFINHLALNLIVTRISDLSTTHKGAVLAMYSAITYIASMVSVLAFSLVFEASGFAHIAFIAAGILFIAFLIALTQKKSVS